MNRPQDFNLSNLYQLFFNKLKRCQKGNHHAKPPFFDGEQALKGYKPII